MRGDEQVLAEAAFARGLLLSQGNKKTTLVKHHKAYRLMPGNAQPARRCCPPDPAFSSRHPALRRVFLWQMHPTGLPARLGPGGQSLSQPRAPLDGGVPHMEGWWVVLLL